MLRPARRLLRLLRHSEETRSRRYALSFDQFENRILLAQVGLIGGYRKFPVEPAITGITVPPLGGSAKRIVVGPDANIWFTTANSIETINLTTNALTAFLVPTVEAMPYGIATGPDGDLWFTESASHKIGSINATTHAIAEYPIPSLPVNGFTEPDGIVVGPDGNVWFTEGSGTAIGLFNPVTHAFSQFILPASQIVGTDPDIVAGPDGNLWFKRYSQIGSINPTTDAINLYSVGADFLGSTLTVGSDGNIWFTGNRQIGTINLTDLQISTFPFSTFLDAFGMTVGPDGNFWCAVAYDGLATFNPITHDVVDIPTRVNGSQIVTEDVVTGPDGKLWFTGSDVSGNTGYIAAIDPDTDAITATALPIVADPNQITNGPDGRLWFTETNANRIGAIDPVTHNFIDVAIPTPNAAPVGITAGPDGNVWFTESAADQVGMIDPKTLAITEFPITAGADPLRIVPGPNGNLWFTEYKGNRVGMINPTTHAVSEFNLPTSSAGPEGITDGPDGNLWFAENTAGAIGAIDPVTHAISEFVVDGISRPTDLTTGPDGQVWFTWNTSIDVGLGVINPSTHAISVFEAQSGQGTAQILNGPDGNLWVTLPNYDMIWQFNVSTDVIYEFDGPPHAAPYIGITTGSDGNLWLTDQFNSLGVITPPAPTRMAELQWGPTGVVVGQPLTLTAYISNDRSDRPLPTGTVTFLNGLTPLGTAQLESDGNFATATLTVPAPSIPDAPYYTKNQIWFLYGGDLLDFPAQESIYIAIGQDSTATTISPSVSESTYGEQITFTSTVAVTAPGAGTPTGLVEFREGTTVLGSSELAMVGGVPTATFAYHDLGVGSHTISAVYLGDRNDKSSQSTTNVTITGPADTTTTVAATPAVVGQPVTITATVSDIAPSMGLATGTVTFRDGNTALGMGTLDASNTATFTTSALLVGKHTITAVYNGDKNNNGSTSTAKSLTVGQDSTTTTVDVPSSPAILGTLTLSATVEVLAPGAGTPTGFVTFFDGPTSLGNGTLSTAGGVTSATLKTSALAVGTHAITAVYGGDANDTGSTSTEAGLSVVQATGVTLSASTNPLVACQQVTLTATVTPASPGTLAPTGSVVFKEGSTTLGSGTLKTSGGITTATLPLASLALGAHAITASYLGDNANLGSVSDTLNLPVNLDQTSTALTASASSVVLGQSVTFTATVAVVSPGAIVPGGTVTFSDGNTALGTGNLSTAKGATTATLTTTHLGLGTHTIVATYGGNSTDATSSSAALTVTVAQDNTATALASSESAPVFSEPVTFTATIGAVAPGTIVPTGTTTFMDGLTTLGTGAISTINGVSKASFTTSTLAVGAHTIIAVYGGDSSDLGSTSSAVNLTVAKDKTTVSLASSVGAPVAGQSVIFTIRVDVAAPGSGTPTGSVDLVVDGNTAASAALTTQDGVTSAAITTSTLSVGDHTIAARYEGDGNDEGSTSPSKALSVGLNSTTTALAVSTNHADFGQTVTLTAAVVVTGAGTNAPTGTVTFLSDNTTLGSGTLATNDGATTATFSTANLPAGTHTITAVYGGDSRNKRSTSNGQGMTIDRDETTTSLSVDPAVFGEAVTLTATVSVVSPGAGTPTGTVSFSADGDTLGTGTLSTTNGVTTATFTTSTLALGPHKIVAAYGGDQSDLGSTSVGQDLKISPDATTIALTPPTENIDYGDAVTLTGTVTISSPGAGIPSGTVTFLDGTTTLGTGTLAEVGGVAMVVFPLPILAPGTHTVTAAYVGDLTDNGSTSSAVTLTVAKAHTAIRLSATSNPLIAGAPETFTAIVKPSNPGAGVPTGKVAFTNGTKVLGVATLRSIGGVATATLKTTVKVLGTSQITAAYAGDTNRAASRSVALALPVGESFTSTTLAASAVAPVSGQPVTFTATVVPTNPKPGAPTGTVTFLDGTTLLGKASLHTVKGKTTATFTTSALSVGAHVILARYEGTTIDLPSTSKSFGVKVAKAHSLASIKASSNPGVAGQVETLTATITIVSPGSGTATGTVTFKDGSTVLGTADLRSTKGVATATLSTSKLTSGKHTIIVVYSGSAKVVSSSSSGLSLTIKKTN